MTTALDLDYRNYDSTGKLEEYFLRLRIKYTMNRQQLINEVATIIRDSIDDAEKVDDYGEADLLIEEYKDTFWMTCEASVHFDITHSRGDYLTPEYTDVRPIYESLNVYDLRVYYADGDHEIELFDLFNVTDNELMKSIWKH